MTSEWVSLNDIYAALLDCKKHKGSSDSCCEFERNQAMNLYLLYEDLNNKTYTIGESIAFCVTRPKIREVFAANYRDRIVHHLLILRYGKLIDNSLIFDTYNCRDNKGNEFGALRLYNNLKENPNSWIVKMDMEGFFYSIKKELLYQKLHDFLVTYYLNDDLENILWLTKLVVMHCPLYNCQIHGNKKYWDLLPDNRSLFKCKEGYGMAIGNLTSQIFANFYLKEFDDAMFEKYGFNYRRYVDDFTITGTREEVLGAIAYARTFLWEHLGIRLHPKKVYIQPSRNGVTFIGFGIKNNRFYTGSRTIYHAFLMVEDYNLLAIEHPEKIHTWIELFAQRLNSYLGFMAHTYSYNFRKKIVFLIDNSIRHYLIIPSNFKKVNVIIQYKGRIKLIKEYHDKTNRHKRQLERDRTCIYLK